MSEMDEAGFNNVDSALLARVDLLDAEYPNKPKNASPSLPFGDLVKFFHTMETIQTQSKGRRGTQLSQHDQRRNLINSFIQRWRKEVGPDVYPAFRLIIPNLDKDRPMYGLKEASLAKILVAVKFTIVHP